MANDNRVKVFARIKPSKRLTELLEIQERSINIRTSSAGEEERLSKAVGVAYDFKFAKVFDCSSSQEDLFDTVSKPIAARFLDGYNGTIFAYGQTGSGKTYTVEGSARRYNQRGIIPRVISYVYDALEKKDPEEDWKIEISFMEIYQDVGYDLLNPGSQGGSMMVKLPKVKVVDSFQKGVTVKNLSLHLAANEEVAHSLLFQGSANRKVAETSMNLHSSRSHAIFTIILTVKYPESDVITKSKLNLVDLAGSERVAKTRSDGRVLNEAKHINLSLHHLEHVIVALHQQTKGRGNSSPGIHPSPRTTPPSTSSRGGPRDTSSAGVPRYTSGLSLSSSRHRPHTRSHVPYRNCLLTMVLKDSLGGNCYTAMIATISGEQMNLGETISTARFAQRVSCIANVVRRNEEVDDKVMIKRLKERIAELEAEVELLRQGVVTTSKQQQQQQQHITSGPLLEGERKQCHQVLYNYLHGRLEDPVEAGVDDSRKFQECLKVMKDIVLHALGIEKQGKGKMATLRDNTSHQKQISTSCQSSVSGKKLLTSTPPPGSRMSSGIGSIGEGEGSRDVSPLQQSHDSHMTSNHIQNIQDPLSSTPPINTVGVDRKQEVSSKKSPASVGTVQNSKQATSPVCRDPEGRRTSSRGVAGVEGKMDKLVQSEEQKRRLKMSVQELQIKVKEEEIRSELDLIREQLAVQHARILSLQKDNTEEETLCQERLAEQQLRVRQAKLHQQLLYIEHTLKVHGIVDVPKPVKCLEGPKSPRNPSTKSLEMQLMAEVASHSKQQSKVNEQIEKLRKSQVEKKLELREAATRRKLLALKQQFSNAQTTTQHSSTSSPPASSLSPSSQQNQSGIGAVTPILSPSDTPTRGELRSGPSAPISPPTNTSTHITTHRISTTQSLPSTSVSDHSTSLSGPDTPFLSLTDTPSHSSSHTGPATPTLSPTYTPTHSTSRNGLAALRERLQVTSPNSEKTGKLRSTVSTSKDSRETPRRQHPVAIPEENKETQFLSQCQRQQERVSRIRRAIAAATVIQRAWRRYKQSHR